MSYLCTTTILLCCAILLYHLSRFNALEIVNAILEKSTNFVHKAMTSQLIHTNLHCLIKFRVNPGRNKFDLRTKKRKETKSLIQNKIISCYSASRACVRTSNYQFSRSERELGIKNCSFMLLKFAAHFANTCACVRTYKHHSERGRTKQVGNLTDTTHPMSVAYLVC